MKPEFVATEPGTNTTVQFRGHGWSLTLPVAVVTAALGALGYSVARPTAPTSDTQARALEACTQGIAQLQADARYRQAVEDTRYRDLDGKVTTLLVRTDKLR